MPRLLEAGIFGSNALIKDSPSAIVPSGFIREWRSWIQRPGDAQRPEGVDNSYIICEHGNLNVNLSDFGDFNEDFAIVSMAEWTTLSSLYA